MIVGVLGMAVGLPIAANRGGDPLSQQERDRLAATAAPSVTETPATVTVAFIGDSYTQGAGASHPDRRFTSVLSRTQGWAESNFGFGGTGYDTALDGSRAEVACGQSICPPYGAALAQVASAAPDLLIVSGGRNDSAASGDAGYDDVVAQFYRDAQAAAPGARIVALSPLWDDDPAPASLANIVTAVQAGVEAVGGTYIDIGQPLKGHPEMVIDDGVHPNDAGHAAIAAAVKDALAAAGLDEGLTK